MRSDQSTAAAELTRREGKPLSDAARRALAEAEARRAVYDAKAAELARQTEINGSQGPEPVRYGDWENKGVASDF